MLAISGLLRPVPAAATGITNVGSKATAQTMTFSTGQLSGAATFALPAGCQVGDTVTITCIGTSYSSGFTWQTPANAIETMSQRTFAAGYSTAVYARTLVQADVDAGNIQVPVALTTSGSWSIPVIGIVDVDRGVSNSYIDVVGALGTGSLAIGPNACAIPGVTTTKDGDLLRYVIFATPASVGATITPPDGYTAGDPPFSVNNGSIYTGLALQSAAGATGDQSVGVSPQQSGTWAGLLIALRPKAPAIILTYALPATATIGAAYTGSITATLVDGATGPVTITATPLPDGVAAGTLVDHGDGSYTLPISGTPTTAQTVSVGMGATNGTQSASATQSVVVSAPVAGPVQQMTALYGNVASWTVQFPQKATVGNTLLINVHSLVSINTPSGWTLVAPGSTSGAGMFVFQRTSDGTETSVAMTTTGATTGRISAGMQEWRGTIVGTTASGLASPTAGTISSGPSSAPPSATAIPVMFTNVGYSNVATMTYDTPWEGVPEALTPDGTSYLATVAWRPAPDAVVTLTGTRLTSTGSNATGWVRWLNLWIEPA